ncbi:PH domain-containing protein [Streptomyces ochraceiscleroticus]|uniref:PH domain-containing protein n=1 Tax=Streptomyces ochraceiscleroticus TaxID=47761 RepID=A0ABW1MGJ2_9ACTN|nr:PH domain-containing protein [Streptomyces ochraceiscleroticus]
MTSPDNSSRTPTQPYADRSYRSPAALVGGVLLLALLAWLGIDALVHGTPRTRLLAVSGLLFTVPLVTAFTLRPVVRANEDRLTVRNPFRTIVLPWASVDDLRASFSCEVFAGDKKYQLWSIPVSLRQRKRANRASAKAAGAAGRGEEPVEVRRASADRALDELRELRERNAIRETAQGPVTVRWMYEIIAPIVVGGAALVVLAVL